MKSLFFILLSLTAVSCLNEGDYNETIKNTAEEFRIIYRADLSDEEVAAEIKAAIMDKYKLALQSKDLKGALYELFTKSLFDLYTQPDSEEKWQIRTSDELSAKGEHFATLFYNLGNFDDFSRMEALMSPYVLTYIAHSIDLRKKADTSFLDSFMQDTARLIFLDRKLTMLRRNERVKKLFEWTNGAGRWFNPLVDLVRSAANLKFNRINILTGMILRILAEASYNSEYITEETSDRLYKRCVDLIEVAVSIITRKFERASSMESKARLEAEEQGDAAKPDEPTKLALEKKQSAKEDLDMLAETVNEWLDFGRKDIEEEGGDLQGPLYLFFGNLQDALIEALPDLKMII